MILNAVSPRFTGTTLINADVLRFSREATILRRLPGYKGLKGDVLVFETGQERPNQMSALNRAYNRRVRDTDNTIAWTAQSIADRYYNGQRHKVIYKTAQVFPKPVRELLAAGVVAHYGWNALGSLKHDAEPRFSGTVFVNRVMVGRLQKDLGLPFSQVPPEISALPSYIPGGHANNEPELSDAATVNFESGEAHSWWSALWDSHKRASNRRIRQQDRAVMRWAKTLADRYAKRQLDDVAFQTERIFTGIDRYLIGVGLNVKHGWGAQRAL